MTERNRARIPFFAGYLRRLGSQSERIARASYLLTATLEESRWENSLDGGFPPTTTYTEPEGRSKGCEEVKLERSTRKSAFAQLVR